MGEDNNMSTSGDRSGGGIGFGGDRYTEVGSQGRDRWRSSAT